MRGHWPPDDWRRPFLFGLFTGAVFLAGMQAMAGVQDGPDVIGSLIFVNTPDGIIAYTPHDFCTDFPTAPYCKREAAKKADGDKPKPDPAPKPEIQPVPSSDTRRPWGPV